jgi:hypothetical protein
MFPFSWWTSHEWILFHWPWFTKFSTNFGFYQDFFEVGWKIFLGRYGRLKQRYHLQRSLLWFVLVSASPLYTGGIGLALGRCLVGHLIRSVWEVFDILDISHRSIYYSNMILGSDSNCREDPALFWKAVLHARLYQNLGWCPERQLNNIFLGVGLSWSYLQLCEVVLLWCVLVWSGIDGPGSISVL